MLMHLACVRVRALLSVYRACLYAYVLLFSVNRACVCVLCVCATCALVAFGRVGTKFG